MEKKETEKKETGVVKNGYVDHNELYLLSLAYDHKSKAARNSFKKIARGF